MPTYHYPKKNLWVCPRACPRVLLLAAALFWASAQAGAAAPGKAEVDAHIQQARQLFSTDKELSRAEAMKALSAARQIGYRRAELEALRIVGVVAFSGGALAQAIAHFDEGLSLIGDAPQWDVLKAGFLLNKGLAYYQYGDWGQALACYLQAAPIYQAAPPTVEYARLLNNLAIVYRSLQRYEDARRIYQTSLSIKSELRDSLGMARTLVNLGLVHGYLKEREAAIQHLQQAKELYERLGNIAEASSVQLSVGNVLYELGELQRATQALQPLLKTEAHELNTHDRIALRLRLAAAEMGQEQYLRAGKYLRTADSLLRPTTFLELKRVFFQLSAKLYAQQGEYQQAWLAMNQYTELMDTLTSKERLQLEKTMEARYLTQEKENLIQIQKLELKANQQQQQNMRWGLFGLGVLSLAIGVVLWQRYKVNQTLKAKHEAVTTALLEKQTLLQEIHHRVKNNLQTIASLLSIQARQIQDPTALRAIRESRSRVDAMALIHKNLYQDTALSNVDLKVYVHKLVQNLIDNYALQERHLIHSQLDIAPIQLHIDTVIPFGLILNELISNALKYGSREREPLRITIAITVGTGNAVALKVADDGPGFPPDFTPWEQPTLGFKLVRTFAHKLGAELRISNSPGAEIAIFFPNTPYRLCPA